MYIQWVTVQEFIIDVGKYIAIKDICPDQFLAELPPMRYFPILTGIKPL